MNVLFPAVEQVKHSASSSDGVEIGRISRTVGGQGRHVSDDPVVTGHGACRAGVGIVRASIDQP